ncbi:MAG: PAS domain S-box protein, partial [Gemmatimonadetes bacterium]|nr:PAS domain S-box protein [Gemmatimonadota bacterium]
MSSGGNGLDALLDAAPCGFVSFVDDGTIRAANATLLRMLGYSSVDLTGKRVETILAVGSRIFYQTHLFPLLRLHGHAEEIFMLLRAKDGSDIAVLLNAVRREREGEWITDCAVMQVRERKKFEEALLRAKKDAEQARAAADERGRELQAANDTLEEQALELEMTQRQLLEQAEELEAQGEELRTLNEALEERSLDLEEQRRIADDAN